MRRYSTKNSGFTPLEISKKHYFRISKRIARNKEFLTGFTLAEILVVTAIGVILMIVGAAIYLSNNRFYQNQSGKIELVSNIRQAADRISEFGRNAVGIETNHTYSSVVYTTGAEGVIFKIPSINVSGNLISGSYDYIIVGRDPGNALRLVLIIDSAAPSSRAARTLELTSKLDTITFSYDNADPMLAKNVNFQIRAENTGPYGASEEVYGGVTLRNK